MAGNSKFLFLSQEDVIRCGGADMAQTLVSVEEAFVLLDQGECLESHAPGLRWGEAGRASISNHPAYVGGDVGMAGIKWQGNNPANPAKGLPNFSGFIILNDPETAYPLAVMDCALISAMRTGAVIGVGAKYFAREDAEIIALIGAGPINRAQLLALHHTVPGLRLVRLFSLTRSKAEAFALDMRPQIDAEIRVVDSAREAIEGADIVAPATHVGRNDQYIQAEWIKPGAYLGNLSGNDYATETMLSCDRIIVDHKKQLGSPHLVISQAVRDGLLRADDIDEFGGIVTGRLPGRIRRDERIFFSPNGMGIEDVINAHRVYQEARRRGVGRELQLWQQPMWT